MAFCRRCRLRLDRMSELSVLSQDVTKTNTDRSNYSVEFTQLQNYISDIGSKNFNGVTLFATSGEAVTIDSDASKFTMNAIDMTSTTAATGLARIYNASTSAITTTPQWVGDNGVQAVVTLGIDDMRGHGRYESFCRPILERLKKIDGRAPISIFCNSITPTEPHLQQWLKEGVTIEVHTLSHPCPILGGRNFVPAKNTYHGGVDLLNNIANNLPVAFRTPCCDSQNTPSPRVFSELLMRNNPAGQFLEMTLGAQHFTSADKSSPPRCSLMPSRGKFERYVPFDSYL